MDFPFDRVKLSLSASRDVPTDTVRVYVEAVISSAPEQSAAVPDLIRNALTQILPTEWTTSFGARLEDNSGMEQIVIQASTRVADAQTAGLSERVRKLSRSGMSLKLRNIEFRPPHQKIEEAQIALRKEIYKMAQSEADALNLTLPSDTLPWRVGSITITIDVKNPERQSDSRQSTSRSRISSQQYSSSPRSRQFEEDDEENHLNLVVGVRVDLTAEVILHRLSILPPKLQKPPAK